VLAPYRRLFTDPEARRLVAASLSARLAIGAFTLPLLLTVQQASGSFATAGVVAGAWSIAVAVSAPVRGRIVDGRGSRRALPAMVGLSATALLLIAVLAELAPVWLLVVLAGLSGGATPPLVAAMRLEWQRVLGPGDPRLAQAYAFESGAQTAMFVVGPLLASAGIAAAGARASLGACAVMLVLGTCAFAVVAGTAPSAAGTRAGSPIRLPGVVTLVLVTALADVALGAVDVLVTAFAAERGRPEVAGVLLAVFAASSVVGALAYGRRAWPLPRAHQLVAILLASAATIGLLALPFSLLAFGALLALAGAPSAAQWAASSLALDDASGGRGGAEAFTWLSAANGVGIAAGNVLGGAAFEQWGLATAFLLAAAAPAAAAVVVALRRATLTPSPACT
jgi:MFS family permease